MRVILTALAVPGFALGLATAAVELTRGEAPVYAQPNSIVWADRVYSNKHDFAVWLRARGARYRAWAAKHPAAAGILERRPASEPTTRAAGAGSSVDARDTGIALMLVVASLLGMLALVATLRSRVPRVALARRTRAGPSRLRWNPRNSLAKLAPQRASAAPLLQSSVTASPQAPPGFEPHVASPQRRATIIRFVQSSMSASRDALAGLQRRVASPKRRATVTRFVEGSLSASRDALTSFEHRVRPTSDTVEDASEYASLLVHKLRRYALSVSFYVMSVLLGLVVGASIVMYLN